MKKILYKRKNDLKKRVKSLSISTLAEDNDSKTYINKSFTYKVSNTDEINPTVTTPHIYITKQFDNKKMIEKFRFEVKGSFYMTHHRSMLKVRFHHILNIQIIWKSKIFSPKKSAVLTE